MPLRAADDNDDAALVDSIAPPIPPQPLPRPGAPPPLPQPPLLPPPPPSPAPFSTGRSHTHPPLTPLFVPAPCRERHAAELRVVPHRRHDCNPRRHGNGRRRVDCALTSAPPPPTAGRSPCGAFSWGPRRVAPCLGETGGVAGRKAQEFLMMIPQYVRNEVVFSPGDGLALCTSCSISTKGACLKIGWWATGMKRAPRLLLRRHSFKLDSSALLG